MWRKMCLRQVRLEGVSFSVHSEVAGLDAKEQREWLTRAKDHDWSAGQIRNLIRVAARTKFLSRSRSRNSVSRRHFTGRARRTP